MVGMICFVKFFLEVGYGFGKGLGVIKRLVLVLC